MPEAFSTDKQIHLWGVKQNNLKNIEVKIPLGSLTVICGPSGSGKSSLAFETLFAEGQRRFIESMSSYARQFLNKAPKPDVEGIENIPPAIALEQKNSVRNSRSTVGTTTEILDYLRLLFEKAAVCHCPTHQIELEHYSVTEATDQMINDFPGERGYLLVEISEKSRVSDPVELLSMFHKDGLTRLYLPANEENPFGELAPYIAKKQKLPKSNFYVVVDRLQFSATDRDRLADSVTLAYEFSRKYNPSRDGRQAFVLTSTGKSKLYKEDPSCPLCDFTPPPLSSRLFSFNSPVGACTACKGFGNTLEIDERKVVPNPQAPLKRAIHPFMMPSASHERKALEAFAKKKKIAINVPWDEQPASARKKIWEGEGDFWGVEGLFRYLETMKYKMHVRVFLSRYRSPVTCRTCGGSKLIPDALLFRLRGKNIHEYASMTIADLCETFQKFELTKVEAEYATDVLTQIRSRLNFLMRVGVHYLTLNRETRTLSGGEYQRIMLANQLGMGLSQTLYVLDEPTIGLHPRDNDLLISVLKDLKDLGNTLVIVEHDPDVIDHSEYLIEMGPGSGSFGGEVIFRGPRADFFDSKESITVPYLLPQDHSTPLRVTRPIDKKNYRFKIELKGCNGNNLKNLDVMVPLHRFVAVTGVSGSGKSTLISKTLYPALASKLDIEHELIAPHKKISGFEHIKNVLLIDQSPIGKTARSSPITYLKTFDLIRNLLSQTDEAKARGYKAGTFSLNVDGGRCPTCEGTGFEEVDMMFMDNILIPCDACDGRKYKKEILEIKFQNKNAFEILSMTVADAMDFFVSHPSIRKSLAVLKEVGLDYICLGQPASTLSGGESQRLKIAKELSQVNSRDTLYILDEPTTGLHFREIDLLLKVLNKLIDQGGSIVVVEHNLDVIKEADYILDLGPEAGEHGGNLVASGTPEEIMATPESLTGLYLKKYLKKKYKHDVHPQ